MSHPPDDDRTVLSTGGMPAPTSEAAHGGPHALPPGTRLSEFEIVEVLGEGGFGIVYLAIDHSLERQVALKEYMPSFAWRSTQAHISVKSAQNADSFEAGRRSFINEARMLAQFDHPSLVKVYRFWEANGTAYMVMPFYRGPTLKQALRERGAAPDEDWIKALLGPLLEALDVIHQHHCFHRDIAPDNILMLDEGRPLLLDFGAARRAIGDMNQAFTVILKQNYAPIEQYAEMPGMSQGAWTDLYALASVVHFAIDGQAPPQALTRMLADPYVPLAIRYAGRYSEAFLAAIDRALAFKPDDRPQSVAAMRSLLELDPAAARTHGAAQTAPGMPPIPPPAQAQAAPSDSPARAVKSRAPLAAVAFAVVAGAGLVAYLNRGDSPITVANAPVHTTAASTTPMPGPTPAPTPPSSPVLRAFSPVAALDAVLAGADPERKVAVDVAKRRARIGKDKISFSVRSAHRGYVYVLIVGTRGEDFLLLFPNSLQKNNEITPGRTLTLPGPDWPIRALGPPGTDHFVVMVSDMPRDFSGAGLTSGDVFSSFPIARAAQLQRDRRGPAPLFAGTPQCAGEPCPGTYGAAAFSIEELAL